MQAVPGCVAGERAFRCAGSSRRASRSATDGAGSLANATARRPPRRTRGSSPLDLGQLAPLELAARGARQLVHDSDLPWDLVARQPLPHKRLQLLLAGARARLEHDEG